MTLSLGLLNSNFKLKKYLKTVIFTTLLLVSILLEPSQCAFKEPPGSVCDISVIQPGNCSTYNYMFFREYGRCLMKTHQTASWKDQNLHCMEYGGHLVKISSEDQNKALNRSFVCGEAKLACRPKQVWIGLKRSSRGLRWISDNSKWSFGDFGETLNPMFYKCFLWDNETLKWDTKICSHNLNGICMEDLESFPKTPVLKTKKSIQKITTAAAGDSFTVECHAFVGAKGKLEFMIQNVADHSLEPANKNGTVEQREDLRLDPTAKCSRFFQAALSLKITKDLEGKKLVAISGSIPHIDPCSEKDQFCLEITSFSVKDPDHDEEENTLGNELLFLFISLCGMLLFFIIAFVLVEKNSKKKRQYTFIQPAGPDVESGSVHSKQASQASKKK